MTHEELVEAVALFCAGSPDGNYIETHRRLSEEVSERTTLDLRKKDKADE